jgi:hypothetical protein
LKERAPDDRPWQRFARAEKAERRADGDRRVRIVAARVRDAGARRAVRNVLLVGHAECIDVGAKRDAWRSRLRRGLRDHSGAGCERPRGQALACEERRKVGCGRVLLAARIRMRVQMAAKLHEPRAERVDALVQCFRPVRHARC